MNRLLWGDDFGRCFCVSNSILVFGCWMMFFFFFELLVVATLGLLLVEVVFFFFLSGWLISFQFWGKDSLRYVYIYIFIYICCYIHVCCMNIFCCVDTKHSVFCMCMQNVHLLILCCGDHPWGMRKTPLLRKEYPHSKSGGFGCYNCFHRFLVADSCFSNAELEQSFGWKNPLDSLASFCVHNYFLANISNIQHIQQFLRLPRGGDFFFLCRLTSEAPTIWAGGSGQRRLVCHEKNAPLSSFIEWDSIRMRIPCLLTQPTDKSWKLLGLPCWYRKNTV